MTQHTPLFVAFAVALSAVVGGALFFDSDVEPQPPVTPEEPAPQQSRDPFVQEYQALEQLLEETRAQRAVRTKQQAEAAVATAVQPTVEEAPATIQPVEPPEELEETPVIEAALPKPESSPQPESNPQRVEVVAEATTVADQPPRVAPQKVEPPVPTEKPKVALLKKVESPLKIASIPPQPVKAKKQKSQKSKKSTRGIQPMTKGNHVQVGAFTDKKRALSIAKDLAESNFKLKVISVKHGGREFYLLRDYSATTQKEALRLKKIYDEWLNVDSLVRY